MVPANAPFLVHLPPGASTHFPLPLTFLHIRGFATEPDIVPIFEQLPPIEAEGFWANVGAGVNTTTRIAIQIAFSRVFVLTTSDFFIYFLCLATIRLLLL